MPRVAGTLAVLFFGVLAMHVGSPDGRAWADPAETKRRLEAAGVEEPLRVRIQAAIARGVSFLRASQAQDGSFRDRWRNTHVTRDEDPVGTTLLCALALRHAAGAVADGPARLALTWSLAQGPDFWHSVESRTDLAGLALRLIRALPLDVQSTCLLEQSLRLTFDDATGYWGDVGPGWVAERAWPSFPGLDQSHHAVLGLWEARQMGIEGSAATWKRHVRALRTEQTRTGSWRWHPLETIRSLHEMTQGGPLNLSADTGEPVGRFMGISNLLLARAAVGSDKPTRATIDAALNKARARLSEDIVWFLDDPADTLTTMSIGRGEEFRVRRDAGSLETPGRGAYHTFLALAHACLLADIATYDRPIPRSPKVVRRSWYADGAEWLLKVQDASGGWSPTAGDPVTSPSEMDTAYALLFLVRAPSTLHPTAPQPMDAVAPGGGAPVAPK